MTAAEYFIQVVGALERLGIPFMVVGSMSSNIYGIPRSTKDAEFVIELGNQGISSLATALGRSTHSIPMSHSKASREPPSTR